MSGGSYDYLFIQTSLEELVAKRYALQQMADRLTELPEADFPGVTAAGHATMSLELYLRLWSSHVEAQTRMLSAVWRAVEWWDSNDSGPDGVRKALAEMLTPTAPPAPEPAAPADPPGPYIVSELALSVTADQVWAEKDAGRPHPEATPVGPFPTRQAADAWASAHVARYGSGSWSIAPLRSPA